MNAKLLLRKVPWPVVRRATLGLFAVIGVALLVIAGGGFFACAASREGAVALCKGALAAR